MNNKKILKPVHLFFIALIFIAFATGGPLIINEMYNHNGGYITSWDAKDVLAYFGSVLGAIATVVALILTIIYTFQQSKIEQQYQLKLAFANYKKTVIEEKYRKVLDNAEQIKSEILLEFLDDTSNIWTTLKNHNNWILTIGNQLNDEYIINQLRSVECGDSNGERQFTEKLVDIRNGMVDKLKTLHEDLTKAEEENRIFQENMKSPNYQLQRIEKQISRANDSKPYDEEKKPETTQDILNKYKRIIISYRDEYKKDFLEVYSGFITYKKLCESEEIEKLYIF